jgi:hypothetical protein
MALAATDGVGKVPARTAGPPEKKAPRPKDGQGAAKSGFLELIFARTADRTGPVIGDVFKGSARGYAIVRITGSGIILIVTNNTAILFHLVSSC